MRIVGGRWRGRTLRSPTGGETRPTADRARQTLFDMLAHAPWAPSGGVCGLHVLDAFAGTGAFGLEALSRGAAHASFVESGRAALAILRGNVALLDAAESSTILAFDILMVPPPPQPASVVFLDPPYRRDLATPAIARLAAANWLAPDALIIVETASDEEAPVVGKLLAERRVGAARLHVFHGAGSSSMIAAGGRR